MLMIPGQPTLGPPTLGPTTLAPVPLPPLGSTIGHVTIMRRLGEGAAPDLAGRLRETATRSRRSYVVDETLVTFLAAEGFETEHVTAGATAAAAVARISGLPVLCGDGWSGDGAGDGAGDGTAHPVPVVATGAPANGAPTDDAPSGGTESDGRLARRLAAGLALALYYADTDVAGLAVRLAADAPCPTLALRYARALQSVLDGLTQEAFDTRDAHGFDLAELLTRASVALGHDVRTIADRSVSIGSFEEAFAELRRRVVVYVECVVSCDVTADRAAARASVLEQHDAIDARRDEGVVLLEEARRHALDVRPGRIPGVAG